MTMWNSTLAVPWHTRDASSQGSWILNDLGRVFYARLGIQWNKTISTGLPGQVLSALDDRVIGGVDYAWSNNQSILRGDYSQAFWSLSTKPGQEGQLLFNVP